MSCHCCQTARVQVLATWLDNGTDFEDEQTLINAELEDWRHYMEPGDVLFSINGGLLARGSVGEGDDGYALELVFESQSYPVPMLVIFEVWRVEAGEDDELLTTVKAELFGVGSRYPLEGHYSTSIPPNNVAYFARNMRLAFGAQVLKES